jgi:radical SAM/Cys-rich protein
LSSTAKSLLARHSQLADTSEQLRILAGDPFSSGELPVFNQKLKDCGRFPLRPSGLEIFQMNVGYKCNQTCSHCHVDAGPDRKEIMTRATMEECLQVIAETSVGTVDLTGGAPEMNPDFRWFVSELTKLGIPDIIVRCNLTIITANKKFHDLPLFFKENRVHVVSSLPFYNPERTDKQRGEGVFRRSIEALKMLNEVGYGMNDTGLKLDLVYNPAGAFLPGPQAALEADFKRILKSDFGIEFNALFCITNLPISRFLEYLISTDNYEDYMATLVSAFNPAAVEGVMCKNTLSVGWDGVLYDCDFNQMLGLGIGSKAKHIRDFMLSDWNQRDIVVSQHCYGCTAGAGSSCQGSTI